MSAPTKQQPAHADVGSIVAAARRRRDVSLRELAKRCGCSRWTIEAVERGTPPSVEVAAALARELREPALEGLGCGKSRKGRKPANAGKRYPAEVLSAADLEAMLAANDKHARGGVTRPRNRALILLLWRAGLRVGEALNLTLRDVDMERRTLRVRKSKTEAGIRTVGLDAMVHEALEEWFECRPRYGEWVFVSLSKHSGTNPGLTPGQLSYTAVSDMLKRLARQAGIKQRVHPHQLRHQFAFEAHREGMALGVLSQALGHKSPMQTMHYAGHVLDRMEVAQAMQRRGAAPAEATPNGETAAILEQLRDLQARIEATLGGSQIAERQAETASVA